MYVTLETFEITAREFLRSSPSRAFQPSAINFLPGPVTVRREVRRAFEQAPESHRGDGFQKDFLATKRQLCELTGARNVELLLGSGTLANDVVAGQLWLTGGRGLVLSNGEFGERLLDHARRFGLSFDALEFAWGEAFDFSAIRQKLEGNLKWVWCVHCETSTGVLNDVNRLKALCSEFKAALCLDCISSIGTVPSEMDDVYLASGSSSKGLRSYPGVSMVFYNHELAAGACAQKSDTPAATRSLPRYLDLAYYAEQTGIPFTFSSNLLHALQAALKGGQWEKRFAALNDLGPWLRASLRELGFVVVAPDECSSPAIVTLALPQDLNSIRIGNLLQESGYLLSYKSEYLQRKNWVQICLMSECGKEKLVSLLNALNRVCFRNRVTAPVK